MIVASSCSMRVPQHFRFTYCYDGNKTRIDSLINSRGFYTITRTFDSYMIGNVKEHIAKSSYSNLMFFDDGTFVTGFYNTTEKERFDRISEMFKKMKEDSTGVEANSFYNSFEWGLYRISGDTIKVQYINHPGPPPNWNAVEKWYKVIDRSTLCEVFSKQIYSKTEVERQDYEKHRLARGQSTAKFVPVEVMPKSSCWLKNEDWFYCTGKVPGSH